MLDRRWRHGGLCAAKALRDVGCEVDLVEISATWTVYGVGMIQQSNVIRAIIAQLGLLEELLGVSLHSTKLDSSKLMVGIRQRFLSLGLRVPEYPASLGVSRLALHNVLLAAARSRGANIRMGVTVASFEEQTETLSVTLSDGTSASYDLLGNS